MEKEVAATQSVWLLTVVTVFHIQLKQLTALNRLFLWKHVIALFPKVIRRWRSADLDRSKECGSRHLLQSYQWDLCGLRMSRAPPGSPGCHKAVEGEKSPSPGALWRSLSGRMETDSCWREKKTRKKKENLMCQLKSQEDTHWIFHASIWIIFVFVQVQLSSSSFSSGSCNRLSVCGGLVSPDAIISPNDDFSILMIDA